MQYRGSKVTEIKHLTSAKLWPDSMLEQSFKIGALFEFDLFEALEKFKRCDDLTLDEQEYKQLLEEELKQYQDE